MISGSPVIFESTRDILGRAVRRPLVTTCVPAAASREADRRSSRGGGTAPSRSCLDTRQGGSLLIRTSGRLLGPHAELDELVAELEPITATLARSPPTSRVDDQLDSSQGVTRRGRCRASAGRSRDRPRRQLYAEQRGAGGQRRPAGVWRCSRSRPTGTTQRRGAGS